MLALTRYAGQKIQIVGPDGSELWLYVFDVDRGKVKLAIDADPDKYKIMRAELLTREPRVPTRTPEEREAVLKGYEPEPCPQCKERKAVRSGGVFVCDGCACRWRGDE